MYSGVTGNSLTNRSNRTEKSSTDRSLIPPCQSACPLHMNIREYVDLVAQGRVMEALQVIRSGNPFPSICAYVCTHPCEEACRRCQVDKAVAIRSLKRFAVEFGGDRMIQAEAETTHPEKTAIVGSGPAGMACAYYLRKLGYAATIFEAHSELGGMLRVGIPQYRLPRTVLDTEVKRLTQMGVEIRTNTPVVSLDLLFELGYKAIFVTIGAHQSLKMGIEGEESAGVIDGATFLREVNLGLCPHGCPAGGKKGEYPLSTKSSGNASKSRRSRAGSRRRGRNSIPGDADRDKSGKGADKLNLCKDGTKRTGYQRQASTSAN
jgi:NADPH-dependent glutamate synthase beta subunit-like oxidoreductase